MTIFRKLVVAPERAEFAERKLEKGDLDCMKRRLPGCTANVNGAAANFCMVFATPA